MEQHEHQVEDITDGKYVNQWVEAARNSNGIGLTPMMTSDEIDKRFRDMIPAPPDFNPK